MNLTIEQKDLLCTIVRVYRSGDPSEFLFVPAGHNSEACLLYDSGHREAVQVQVSDFHCLQEEGLVTLQPAPHGGLRAKLRQAGLEAIENGFTRLSDRVTASPASVQTTNIFGGRIENLVQSVGDGVAITQGAGFELSRLFDLVDKMVDAVTSASELSSHRKNDYEIDAQSFKGELRKAKINLTRVREILGVLGDLDGALGLTARLAPYYAQLAAGVESILRQG